MLARFPRLSKVATKILELAGAGCASALAASLLGNTREAAPPPSPPAVVRLAPIDEQMIRFVRNEGVPPVEQLRSVSDQHSASAPSPTSLPQPSKPAKVASSTPARREPKSTPAPVIETKQRAPEPPGVQSTTVSTGAEATRGATSPAAASERMPPPPSAAGDIPSSSAQTQVPLRLWPTAATTALPDAPRPPVGVGDQRSM